MAVAISSATGETFFWNGSAWIQGSRADQVFDFTVFAAECGGNTNTNVFDKTAGTKLLTTCGARSGDATDDDATTDRLFTGAVALNTATGETFFWTGTAWRAGARSSQVFVAIGKENTASKV